MHFGTILSRAGRASLALAFTALTNQLYELPFVSETAGEWKQVTGAPRNPEELQALVGTST